MLNSVTIVGRLGRDPELRYTGDGLAVATLSVATDSFKKEAGKFTVWFRVTAWGRQAENCNQFLRKGSTVAVVGQLTADPETGGPRMWESKSGKVGASFEISANSVTFVSGFGDSADEAGVEAEEIPFA